jgi:acyl-coenzyme A thioesterase PaaI-like protein
LRSPCLGDVPIKVNYLPPVQKRKLVAKGRCIKIGKILALGDVFINGTEGNLLAHGEAFMMIVANLKIEGCGSLLNLKDGDDFGQID